MRITEARLRTIIREELLKEASETGTLKFKSGPDAGSDSAIPFSYTQRADNQIVITNTEPGSLLSVKFDNIRAGVQEILFKAEDLRAGKHTQLGPETMGYADYGVFHIYIVMQTRNGNTLTREILLQDAPTASGFELSVGR